MRLFVLLMILLAGSVAVAADFTVKGIVRDEAEKALPGVIVTVKIGDNEQAAYAITEDDGSFELEFSCEQKSVDITAGILGYGNKTQTVALPAKKLLMFDLKPEAIALKEVHISAKPIRAQGDTLIYNVASFKSASDRSIEDVMKRMPGIQVSSNGMIYYNGLPINRFYIENADMLQGRYSLATRNLSADDIATVDVYQEHQPKKVLEGIEYSDRAAINLKLKKSSLLRPIGNVKAGGGYGDGRSLWLGELTAMTVSPQWQMMVVGKAANIGRTYAAELVDHLNSSSSSHPLGVSMFTTELFSRPPLPDTRYNFNRTAIASANMLRKFSNEKSLTVNLAYSHDRSETEGSSLATYNIEGREPLDIETRSEALMRKSEASARVNYTANTKTLYMLENASFRGTFTSNDYSVRGTNTAGESLDIDNFTFSNNLKLTVRRGARVTEISSVVTYNHNPEGGIAVSCGGDDGSFRQYAASKRFYTNERTSFAWLVGRYSTIGIKLSLTAYYDKLDTWFSRGGDTPAATDVAPSLGMNNIGGWRGTVDLGPYFSWDNSKVIFRLNVPLALTGIDYDNRLTGRRHTHAALYPGVAASLVYKPRRVWGLSLGGGYNQTTGDIGSFITGPVYRSYRDMSGVGTETLSLRRTASARTSVSYNNPIESLFGTLALRTEWGKHNTLASTDVSADQTVSGRLAADSRSRNSGADFNISKRIRTINTTVKFIGVYDFMRMSSLRNGFELTTDLSSYSVMASALGTFMHDRIAIGLQARWSKSDQKMRMAGAIRSSFTNIDAKGSLSLFPLKPVEVYVMVAYMHNQLAADRFVNPVFVDAGMRYRAKRWEVELMLNNLTDRRSFAYQLYSGADRFYYSYRLRPAEAIASFRLSF